MQRKNHKPLRHQSRRKPGQCPSCKSPNVAVILYGLPEFSKKLDSDLKAKRITLGGCCVTDADPTWRCLDCDAVIFRSVTPDDVRGAPR